MYLYDKGLTLQILGRYDDAISCYDEALKVYPRADAWNNKGNVYLKADRYDDALECYDKALNIDPNFVNALNGKGRALEGLGKYDDALECYDKALEIDDTDALIWYNKAYVLEELGKHEATQCYKKALRLNPHITEELQRKDFEFLPSKRYGSVLRNAKSRFK